MTVLRDIWVRREVTVRDRGSDDDEIAEAARLKPILGLLALAMSRHLAIKAPAGDYVLTLSATPREQAP